MARASISAYSATQTSNTLITDDSTDISIAEGFAAANINNAIRTLMTHLADAYAGDAAYDSVTNSVSAGATQTQAGATALTTTINRVTTVGTNGDGVKLPTAVAGLQVLVINDDSAQTLKVWPATSDAIDGGSANAVDANQIAAGASRLYVAIDATNWYTALNDLGSIPLGVASGGTGAATLTDGGILLGSGTGAVTATAVLADGEILVGDGTTDPVAESGATARTSLGLGTGDSPTFVTVTASTSIVPDAAGGADLGSASAEWGDVYIADDKALKLGNDQNFTIEYDENGTDTTRIVAAAGVSLAPHGTSSGNTTELRFMELAAGGNNYVGLKAPDACSDSVYQLPASFPASNKYMQSTDAGVLTWESISTPASPDTVIKTSAYTVVAGDDQKTILVSAASASYELALTAAATLGDGWTCTIKKSDASKFMVTVNPSGSEVIDGLLTLKLRQEHASVTLICDGSNFHIISHENVAIEQNAIENASFTVDQYGHVTRSGLQNSSLGIQDRWFYMGGASPPAIWTYSNESNGGTDAKSKWGKWLCTTGGSPDATDHANIRQTIIGNNGGGFLGTDGLFENAVLSMDVIGHLNTPDAPYVLAIGVKTLQGTARQYIGHVTITTDAVWQRVSLVIPEDSTADIDPGTGSDWQIGIGLIGGSSRLATANTWENNVANVSNTSGSQNWGATANNYLGIANVKLQPGQIATPFIPRSYAEELDICKYYAEKLSYDTNGFQLVAIGGFSANNAIQASVTYEEKRATPAITSSAAGTFQLNAYAVGGNDATSVAYNEPGKTNFRFAAEYGGTGYTQDNAGQIRRDATDDTYIFITAEI